MNHPAKEQQLVTQLLQDINLEQLKAKVVAMLEANPAVTITHIDGKGIFFTTERYIGPNDFQNFIDSNTFAPTAPNIGGNHSWD